MTPCVITGIGAVTPLGPTFPKTWDTLLRGESGIVSLDPEQYPACSVKVGGPLSGFVPRAYLTEKEMHRWDPFMWYAVAAASMAIDDADLQPGHLQDNPRVGLIMGSSRGGIRTLTGAFVNRTFTNRVSPFLMASTTPYMAAAACAMKLGMSGPSLGISSTCTSGTLALMEACSWISSGRVDLVLAGGTDAALCPLALSGYRAAGVLSKNDDPVEASRPFDAARDGFVLSEGACVLVIESGRHAAERGARIHGSIVGTGNTTAPAHETRPDAGHAARAIMTALADAGISPEEVAAVNAHAPSTRLGDAAEAAALHQALGPWAKRVPVTANKSQTGHLLAASGVLETALSLFSLKGHILPATLNYKTPDPACDLNVSTHPRSLDGSYVLSNSFGFGGSNAVLVLEGPP